MSSETVTKIEPLKCARIETTHTRTQTIVWPALDLLASELRLLRLIAQHAVGWPLPPDPAQIPAIQSGEETTMGIKILVTPVDVNNEPFTDAEKTEIAQYQLTPLFDNVEQPSILKDKADLATVEIVAPQGATVRVTHRWVDNAGNPSARTVETDSVLAADITPPPNPIGVPGIAVGDEIPD